MRWIKSEFHRENKDRLTVKVISQSMWSNHFDCQYSSDFFLFVTEDTSVFRCITNNFEKLKWHHQQLILCYLFRYNRDIFHIDSFFSSSFDADFEENPRRINLKEYLSPIITVEEVSLFVHLFYRLFWFPFGFFSVTVYIVRGFGGLWHR